MVLFAAEDAPGFVEIAETVSMISHNLQASSVPGAADAMSLHNVEY
jgi:hypothetical protein